MPESSRSGWNSAGGGVCLRNQPSPKHAMTRTSILINNYNNAPYLRECVDSALAQTRPAGEVIVYDDGSDDGSIAILRGYGRRIALIEGARASARGNLDNQAHAVAEAFRRSAGELVFLLDGDDVFLPGKIERYTAAFEASPVETVAVQATSIMIDERGITRGRRANALPPGADYRAATYAHNDVDFYQPTSALAFRRDFLAKILSFAAYEAEGVGLAIDTRIAILAPLYGKVLALEEPLTAWRRHSRSHSVQNKTRMADETLKRARYFNTFCRAHGFPTISLWRNTRFYKQLARRIAPDFVGDAFARVETG